MHSRRPCKARRLRSQRFVESMMHRSDDFLNTAELDYDGFKDMLRKDWGRYTPTAIEPEAFTGRVRARSVCGFLAMDLTCNAHSIERTYATFALMIWSTTMPRSRLPAGRRSFRTIGSSRSGPAMSSS